MHYLSKDQTVSLAQPASASGTTTVTSGTVDMQQQNAACFLLSLGTPNAANNVRVQQGNLADGSDATDLAGSKVIPTGAGPAAILLDVIRPSKRYVRVLVTRGVATTVGDIWALRYSPNVRPIVNSSTSQFVNTLVDPVEGVA